MLYLWSAMAKSAIITKNYRDKKNYQDTILTVSTAKCTHPIFLSSTSFSWLIYITFLSSTCFSYPTSLRNLPRHHWPPWRVLRCERGAMEVLVSENTFQTTEDSVESSAGKTPCESPENLLPMMFKSSPILTWLVNQKKKKSIQSITQLLLFGNSQNFIGFFYSWLLTFVGAMAGGLEKVLYNVHDMNEKNHAQWSEGHRGPVTFSESTDQILRHQMIVKPECPPVLFFATVSSSMINHGRWGPTTVFFPRR